ncbi:thiamine pyrophosphate-binding protein [Modestobacter sp. VKM Ac-2979]|uniref:thiamine pyrophosphate-binding protein n=1 Tax=unclassified Modestobacter TaxID=2643866 RepID=UPI0022AB5A0A|nr:MULTISPECIES: thiamine pyrophosphate-binding protein [unclassified Modestobacter]MCZ2814206.1 thiamine pyrophosphate-binding protein [Modestobacter sp. VKM Ac-2979]MCZ2844102.1 thiamine pyrophosphate-binding protein [Modestobacter sp. VKM Ac-2980]
MTAGTTIGRPPSATTTVVEQLAATMAALGTTDLFTLMGAGNLRLVHHLATGHGVAVHHLRHENGAVGAADGWARVTGRVGWCTVTQGPGFTNTLTALLTADRAHSPVVLITSDSSGLSARQAPFAGGVQGLDPELLLDPLGLPVVRARAETAAADLVTAHRRAVEESRVVVFVVPVGIDLLPAGDPPAVAAPVRRPVPEPDAAALAAAVAAIASSRRPVVVAGRGAVESGAGPALRRLAALTGAHLTTTVRALGLFEGDPADLGILGGFSTPEAAAVVAEADCLVAVGTSLNFFHTRRSQFVTGRTVVHVDADAAAFTAFDEPTVAVRGDARAVAERLGAELAGRVGERARAVAPVPGGFADVSAPGRMDPRAVSVELDRLLPRPRRVYVDNGHFGGFPIMHMTHDRPGSLVWLPEFGAVGSALAASAAGALAEPDGQAVLFIGDCGFYLTMGDLELAVRERLPLVVVCMNDGAAGSELAHMKDWSVPPEQAVFGYADLAAAARGMGAQAALVQEVAGLAPALRDWDPAAGPMFLDCHISRDVRSPLYDHV